MGHAYTSAIDIWSLGCILIELVCGEPLFPATTELDLMCKMIDLIGLPPTPFLEKTSKSKLSRFFVQVRQGEYRVLPFKNHRPRNIALSGILDSRKRKAGHVASTSDEARLLDLASRMLQFDPLDRITAEEALKHPFFVRMIDVNVGTE